MSKINLSDYVKESDGVWNCPSIDSEILDYYKHGVEPIYSGGCMAILPIDDDNVLILGEDDDHYFDEFKCSIDDLKVLSDIQDSINKYISVDIDFVKCSRKTKYTKSKKLFFKKNFSNGIFKVSMEDMGKYPPLVNIKIDNVKRDISFDAYWGNDRYNVINNFLNREK